MEINKKTIASLYKIRAEHFNHYIKAENNENNLRIIYFIQSLKSKTLKNFITS